MSSASAALPSMRYAMPKSSGRHSSKARASVSRSGGDMSGGDTSGNGIRADVPHRYLALVREPLAAQAQAGIEPGAEILEGNPSGELDELCVTEVRPHAGGQSLGHLSPSSGCHLRVLEDRPLALVEEIARTPAADRSHLGRIDA